MRHHHATSSSYAGFLAASNRRTVSRLQLQPDAGKQTPHSINANSCGNDRGVSVNRRTMADALSGEANASLFTSRYFSQAVVVSMLVTAVLMSLDSFPVAFQVVAFSVSLLAGFIIEFMFSGDKYE